MRKRSTNKIIQLICQIILGFIFVYAAVGKIIYPGIFENAIKSYSNVPVKFTKIFVYAIPFVELIFGIFLLVGYFVRTSAIILSSFLVLFIILLIYAEIKGLNVDCGCFVKFSSESEIINKSNLELIIRDIMFLIPGIIIIFSKKTNGRSRRLRVAL
jgi:putative oxidoreductase